MRRSEQDGATRRDGPDRRDPRTWRDNEIDDYAHDIADE
jgi:hypothetical protein